ncbi:MAG TPA: type VII secretion protein EccCb [Candidatus Dormibacteraeota bacterium]|nr:type VII secretion protein EccCb [Candidatus Dormibacteraeota bacterium]
MSTVVLHRPARLLPPPVPDQEVVVSAPPGEPSGPGLAWWPQLLFPVVTVLGSAYFIAFNPNPTFIAISVTMALASVAISMAIVLQQLTLARRRAREDRDRYLAYLEQLGEEARAVARRQEEASRFVHPRLVELWAMACDRARVWERRPTDPDFATVRIGRGPVPLATPLRLEAGDPLGHRRPDLLRAAERLVAAYRFVPDQPVLLDLRQHPVVSVVGPREVGRTVARAALLELATCCAPDDLMVAVGTDPAVEGDWAPARWLPHALDPEGGLRFGPGERVLEGLEGEIARRRERARRRLGAGRAGEVEPQPHLLVVVDGYSAGSSLSRREGLRELVERAPDFDASLLFLVETQRDEPPRVDARIRVEASGAFVAEVGRADRRAGVVEPGEPGLEEALARRLAPLRLGEREAASALTETRSLFQLLGAGAAQELDVEGRWRSRPPEDLLRVPIGVGADGGPEVLDLREAAQGGMGPHGLVIGATGSGKSELLRTLITALAVTHPPQTLAMVLVDFKGGAAFADLAPLPHVAGMITNLADDLTMVDRMQAALFGEMQRRQGLLRRAGNLDSVREYQRRQASGQLEGWEPLPYLLIVVDEFGELLASRPDFIDLFVAIGRVGRSLGMHLLLASQRLEEGRLRGLESHLSFRICLRTFSPAESHAVLGTNDAYTLPPIPGSAYLKVHSERLDRFRAAFVSGPAVDRGPRPAPAGALEAWGLALAAPLPGADVVRTDPESPSEMSVAVARVVATGAPRAHQVWLPPLAGRVPLHRLLPTPRRLGERGLQAAERPAPGPLQVPLGLLDLPLEQAQRPFLVDLAGWAGHLVVVGAPQSGKSTLLVTLALALLATHTPDEVRIYAIDYGGGSLSALASAPHVGDVAVRTEPEKVRRTIAQLWAMVDERDLRLRELGVDSPETLRRRRAEGSLPPELACDVFLLIDGWGAVRDEVEDLEAELRDLAARGLRVACHLVLTANRWQEVRPNLRDLIGGRLELRLNEPAESEIDRRMAAAIPVGTPGRALAPDGHHLQVALPDLGAPLEEVLEAMAAAWPGPVASPIRVLPGRVRPEDLPPPGDEGVVIGVEERAMSPVTLDLRGADAHFLVFGDAESGKTTFLRSWMRGLQRRQGAAEAMFLVVDYRRTLLGVVGGDQLWAYCGAAPPTAAAVQELASGIVERLPPPDLAPEAIAARSWWSGPDFYVVVDDYDLVASSSGNPLLPLVDLLAQGRDLGLHLVLARRVGGMARAGLDPLLGRLRELRTPGLILSGDPAEGPVLGLHRATHQPPGRGLLVRRGMPPVLVQTVDGG